MEGRVDRKQFSTLLLTTILIFGFVNFVIINGIVIDHKLNNSDEINSLEDFNNLKDLNPTTLDQLPKEVQSNVRQTLDRFQGGFMRSPDSPYYFLKSSSLTMLFKESEIVLRIPQYEQVSSEIDEVEIAFGENDRQTPSIIGMTEVVLHFPGSNKVNAIAESPQSARYNYFKGDESQWIRNAPYYQKLVYRNLYDNIDLVYDMSQGDLKYEFLVHPGGDYHQIELEWLGDLYMSQIDEGMVFSIKTPDGVFPITDNNPINFIGIDGSEEISGEFTILDENSYGFNIEEYDRSKELIIDPKVDLVFSTLLGGSGDDIGLAIALDASNNVYITGYTRDDVTDFPTTPGAHNETHNGGYADVFVTKLSSDGSTVFFSTLLGGSGNDQSVGIVIDSFNNVYITGSTDDAVIDFPTTPSAHNQTHNGQSDIFVTKLSSDGSTLIFSTFIGGSGLDYGYGIALDASNNVYITGQTRNHTINFPTTPGAYNEVYNGGISDVFLAKLSSDGSILLFSTLIGGAGRDTGSAITIDASNNVYVTGSTENSTTDFPTTPGTYNESSNGGYDAFITKLSSDGSTLLFSTLIGGSSGDSGRAIALDVYNNVYITGHTSDGVTDFPTTPGAYNESHNGGFVDVFVAKLSSDGSTLVFSTLIGGSGRDYGYAIALDSSNDVYITGFTDYSANDFPTTPGAYNQTHSGSDELFFTKLSSDGSTLIFSTLMGGSGGDRGQAIVLDASNNVYIVGYTDDSTIDFPTTPGAYDQTQSGNFDVLVVRMNIEEFISPEVTGLSRILYDFNSLGNQINWTVEDHNPSIFNITLDGIIIVSDTNWSNGIISLNIDGLEIGIYNYTIHVYDYWGNLKEHSVIVIVTVFNLRTDLWFSTLIGGSGLEQGEAIVLDDYNNVYITGYTRDDVTDFPTTPGAYNQAHNGAYDVFVTKLSSDGSTLIFSTLIGGYSIDNAYAIALDDFNNIYITGDTWDSITDFPTTTGAYNQTHNGDRDVFVTKLSSDGSTLIFSTLIGGSGQDQAQAIALDAYNNVYITGFTFGWTTGYPITPGVYNQSHNGDYDVFITKLSSNGSTLIFSTLIGGSGFDFGSAIALDAFNNVYIAGYTDDTAVDFPTTSGAYNQTHNGNYDVFITKLSSDGSTLIFSTLIGGSGNDIGSAIALDAFNNVYITGETWNHTIDFPTTTGVYNEVYNGGISDAFVTKLSSDGSALVFSTLIGGSGRERGEAIVLDDYNNVYITGITGSSITNFPTTPGAYNESWGSVFVTKLLSDGSTLLFSTRLGGSGSSEGSAIALDASNNVYITGYTDSRFIDFPTTPGAYNESYNGGPYDGFVTKILVEEINSPEISTEVNNYYEFDSTGHQINWSISDVNLMSFNITLDGIVVVTQLNWSNGTISWNIDGLSIGDYNYTIYVKDYWGNLETDTVIVSVRDSTPAKLLSPDNVNIEYKSIGNQLAWNISDPLPDVYIIILDGENYTSTLSWSNGTSSVNIDNLNLGQHNFTIYVYDTSGNLISSSVIVTVVDTVKPILSSSDNIIYELGSTNNSISWVPYDHDPSTYRVLLNGSVIETGSWNASQSIIIGVDSLFSSVHNFTIIITDGSGNNSTNTILVVVIDPFNPEVSVTSIVVDNVFDLSYELGSTDNSISWIATDLEPDNYEILVNGTLIKSGEWTTNEEIGISIDGYQIGFHNFTIIFSDKSGNIVGHYVIIRVHDTQKPILDFTKNNELNQEIIAGETMIILIEDIGVVTRIEYRWNNGELMTVFPNSTEGLTLNQALEKYYFNILVPVELAGTEATLQIIPYDESGNSDTFFFDVIVLSSHPSDDPFGFPQEVLLGIVVASVLAVSTGILRLRQRRKMDKAFDDLETDFGISEVTGEGKNE